MKIFGILNVTPDSFSDGGLRFKEVDALKAAEKMLADGSDFIDIGAESTRPGADVLTPEMEISRIAQILPKIVKMGAKVSIDTRNAATAEFALGEGACVLNDVSGLENPEMCRLLARFPQVRGVFMHSLTVPASKEITMKESGLELVEKLAIWRDERAAFIESFGVKHGQLIFDPGLGFGKTASGSLDILRHISKLKSDIPLFIGHSRKSFLRPIFGEPKDAEEADWATSTISAYLLGKCDFLRVHNTSLAKKLLALLPA